MEAFVLIIVTFSAFDTRLPHCLRGHFSCLRQRYELKVCVLKSLAGSGKSFANYSAPMSRLINAGFHPFKQLFRYIFPCINHFR